MVSVPGPARVPYPARIQAPGPRGDAGRMSAPLPCPPAQIETVRHTRFLGPEPIPAGQQAKVLGMAADNRFVYTTYHRHAIRAP